MNRSRTTTAVLATAGAITAAQLGLAGAASASTPTPRPSVQTVAPQSAPSAAANTGCPIDIVYTSRFYIGPGGWVTNGGLYFGIKNKSSKTFKKVSFTVTNVKNVRFGSAKAKGKGAKITRKTSQSVTVYDGTFKGRASLGVKVKSRLLNTRHYKVKFKVRGNGWNCSVNQGTWGA
ncbi:hypothetical protein [Streptomyces sp. NPDC059063]|uniref:hypothetical protein n=1 Tax=unclassified Streptomyces TaxID=2593676 RepID=UPI0036B0B693